MKALKYHDELFCLRNREAILEFTKDLFLYNQMNFKRKNVYLRLSDKSATINDLKIRLTSSKLDSEIGVTTDNEDKIDSCNLSQMNNKSMPDEWRLRISADDNPVLIIYCKLDLSELNDPVFLTEYNFKYRS